MNPKDIIHNSWYPVMNELYQEPLIDLNEKVLPNISFQPERKNIFRVFSMPLSEIRVVILGQDPYPLPGDAVGYAFAMNPIKEKKPALLRIIEQEVRESGQINPSDEICLHAWSDQGVFLLNTALTVETNRAGSHLKYWKNFTKKVVSHISTYHPCVWILWGKKAQEYIPYINKKPFHVKGYDNETIKEVPYHPDWNYILTAPHPAAEIYTGGNAGFFGCNHFLFTNEILKKKHLKQIIW